MDRREVLGLSAAAGAASVLTLRGVSFAHARERGREGGSGEESRKVRGHLPNGAPDFVHLPVQVPRGVRELAVSYSYDRPAVPSGTPGNALDIGIFDERGTGAGGRGFRGWSGGFRTEFAISAERATPRWRCGWRCRGCRTARCGC